MRSKTPSAYVLTVLPACQTFARITVADKEEESDGNGVSVEKEDNVGHEDWAKSMKEFQEMVGDQRTHGRIMHL